MHNDNVPAPLVKVAIPARIWGWLQEYDIIGVDADRMPELEQEWRYALNDRATWTKRGRGMTGTFEVSRAALKEMLDEFEDRACTQDMFISMREETQIQPSILRNYVKRTRAKHGI